MRRPVTMFFLLAFVITWAVWIPRAIDPHGPAEVLGQVWSYGPAFAAVGVAAFTGGLGDLGRRLIRWRVGLFWYAVALLGPVVVSLVIAGVNVLLGGKWALAWESPGGLLALFAALALTDGLGEETGWRGFALPRMLTRMSPLTASLTLGLVWAAWHLPLFWTGRPGWSATASWGSTRACRSCSRRPGRRRGWSWPVAVRCDP
ncbi:CPBP family intramembrane glutamic endopeptidase [Nonomuraea sp. 3N208]|uniref:CPBP family intramembrane glutamic endopeptidase n=1 Tax=Nonomuraea sp. 3N208 TaxID=3457421 RepID=UPI003FD64478